MKKRILTVLIAFVIIITAIPFSVHAEGETPVAKAFGTSESFAKDAPISTVRIDRYKINSMNAILYHPDNSVGFRLDEDGFVYAPRCRVKEGYVGLGYFTLTFANAAILADGTRKDLVVRFGDVTTIGKIGEDYYDYLKFVRITDNANEPLVFAPLSVNAAKHLCIRSAVSFYVTGAGTGDTMLFAADSINTSREASDSFARIHHAQGHYNYSESMEPLRGVAEGADFYLTESSCLKVVEGTSPNTYGTRFVGNGVEQSYSDGFATVAMAKDGFETRVWSSAGTNTVPLEIGFLTPVEGYSLETASGENGSISLWADGSANSEQAAMLSGGTTETPLTYYVPGGKSVTLVITPDSGYDLETLSLNGETVEPTRTQYKTDGSIYYEYDLPAGIVDMASVAANFEQKHFHKLSYTESTDGFGAVIHCTAENCPWTDSKMTVSASIPDVIRFGDQQISSITVSGKGELATATENKVQAKLVYSMEGADDVEYPGFPFQCGEILATITITDALNPHNVQTFSVSKTVNYEKADMEPGIIMHCWTYGDEPVTPRLAASTNPEYARTVYYYKPCDADDSAYTTDVPVNAGKYTLKAVRPETAHYKEGVATAGFEIYQATPMVPAAPEGVTAVYGTALRDVPLLENWSWNTPERSVGSPGETVFAATFTPEDSVNYRSVAVEIPVTVTKRPVTITAEDKRSTLGSTLQDLTYTVSGGVLDGDDLGIMLETNADTNVAGDYEITVSAEHPHYDITLVGGTYTVDAVQPREEDTADNTANTPAEATGQSASATTVSAKTSPSTGDVLQWFVALLLVSAAGLITAAVVRKKRLTK
ncbi:MAG: hypothetical protein E7517_01915 [Ruminococcaceae bacterium]|nr:hypothetical protein [Oscillospiraceae bacterium]